MTLHLTRRNGRWTVKGRRYADIPAEVRHAGHRWLLDVALHGCRGGSFMGRPLPDGRAVACYVLAD